MKKWYKESYFDSNSWLLENFDKLNLNNEETLFIIFINYCNKNKITISYELLNKKFKLSNKQIDNIIANLVNKHYLKLKTNSKGLIFDIDSIYEFDPTKYEISNNQTLYDTLGDLFGKPLSPMELQKINELLSIYNENQILEASRIAEANNKLNIRYIEGILRNEK